MTQPRFHALVVDDEPLVRRLTIRALVDEGFQCDEAADGNEALATMAAQRFDVVVTDLRMPHKHGHALAVELLEKPDHPVIFVLTGCIEPRLATDLLNRGVADVLFKPVDYCVLAVKVRTSLENRGKHVEEATASELPPAAPPDGGSAFTTNDRHPVSQLEIERKLALITQFPPVADVDAELLSRAQSPDADVGELEALVERDPALIVECLRRANAPHEGKSIQPVDNVRDAVARIGRVQIGEIAVASAALRNTWTLLIPWLDRAVVRRRSLAAGIALDRLIQQGGHQENSQGLALCARASGLGRVALGMLYSGLYETLLRNCAAEQSPLVFEECRAFEIGHPQVLAGLLEIWKLPDVVRLVVQYLGEPCSSLDSRSELLRDRVELVKIATQAAKLAVGHWADWDLIEVPPMKTLKRLRIESLGRVVRETRDELLRLGELASSGRRDERTAPPGRRKINYRNLSPLSCDVIGCVLASTNIGAVFCKDEAELPAGPVVFNCLGLEAGDAFERVRSAGPRRPIIICNHKDGQKFPKACEVVTLPTSFGRLIRALDSPE